MRKIILSILILVFMVTSAYADTNLKYTAQSVKAYLGEDFEPGVWVVWITESSESNLNVTCYKVNIHNEAQLRRVVGVINVVNPLKKGASITITVAGEYFPAGLEVEMSKPVYIGEDSMMTQTAPDPAYVVALPTKPGTMLVNPGMFTGGGGGGGSDPLPKPYVNGKYLHVGANNVLDWADAKGERGKDGDGIKYIGCVPNNVDPYRLDILMDMTSGNRIVVTSPNLRGSIGLTGANGLRGDIGLTGLTGAAGNDGKQGLKGDTGISLAKVTTKENAANNGMIDMTFTFSDGANTTITTQSLKGKDGKDAVPLKSINAEPNSLDQYKLDIIFVYNDMTEKRITTMNLRGKDGAQGIQGLKGDAGANGTKGDVGSSGKDGVGITTITATPYVDPAKFQITFNKTDSTSQTIVTPSLKGDKGNDGKGLATKGVWKQGNSYVVNDLVTCQDFTNSYITFYVCLIDDPNSPNAPINRASVWQYIGSINGGGSLATEVHVESNFAPNSGKQYTDARFGHEICFVEVLSDPTGSQIWEMEDVGRNADFSVEIGDGNMTVKRKNAYTVGAKVMIVVNWLGKSYDQSLKPLPKP